MAGKRRREPLGREKILGAAMKLVDAEGLEALSMRRLGSELGVEGMSLYRHVRNKEALLYSLVEQMYAEIDPEAPLHGDWKERLISVMRSYRQVGLKHPHIFMLSLSRQWGFAARTRLEEDIGTLIRA